MSLRTSLKRSRSQVPGLDAGTEKKAQKKKKDEKSKRKELPPLADEGPFVPLHRLFGYDKHKTLRPLEIVERRRTPALSGEIGAYDPEEQLLALAAQRGVHPYEYYVHFLGKCPRKRLPNDAHARICFSRLATMLSF